MPFLHQSGSQPSVSLFDLQRTGGASIAPALLAQGATRESPARVRAFQPTGRAKAENAA